mgnify:CR=1 FL=1
MNIREIVIGAIILIVSMCSFSLIWNFFTADRQIRYYYLANHYSSAAICSDIDYEIDPCVQMNGIEISKIVRNINELNKVLNNEKIIRKIY